MHTRYADASMSNNGLTGNCPTAAVVHAFLSKVFVAIFS